jgi:hypothetical protein
MKRSVKYPAIRYELAFDVHEGGVVLERVRRKEEVMGWVITRTQYHLFQYVLPKETERKDRILFMECVDLSHEDLTDYLFRTQAEAFSWWAANRERTVLFHQDRIRLAGRITDEEEVADGSNESGGSDAGSGE